jgi:hypothetical protein
MMIDRSQYLDDDVYEFATLVSTHSFRLKEIPSVRVLVSIWRISEPHSGQHYKYEISHSMRTPMQSGPYYPGSPYSHSPADALQKAVSDLTHYYSSAISAGHKPAEDWLVSNIRQRQAAERHAPE